MLSVRSLSKRFSGERTVDAVCAVDVELERGRFLAMVGRSGSGKSTLLAMIGGISRPTAGSVLIDGVDQWSLHDSARADFRNRTIGFVFQFASLLPTLRAIDNVALPALVGGVLGYRESYARAHALLDRVGLGERFDSFPGQLSGGEQRRVAIARALINAPEVLLADEPTADLDEKTEEEILNLLVEIHRAFKLTLVVVTHNRAVAARADQLLEMRAGQAATSEVQESPAPAKTNSHAAEQAAQVRSIFEIPAQAAAAERVRLGEGIERFLGRFFLWAIPLCLLIWGLNLVIERYEQGVIAAKLSQRQALEELAMSGLRAEVEGVNFGPGTSYLVSIYLRNTTAAQPIYVLSPTVRAFVQVGSSWQEVPLRPADSSAPKVLKVTGKQVYRYLLQADVRDFAQLLPYYMHVRISNDMLISPRSEPRDDLVERNDNYYVYLKPHGADDAAILSKLKFPGTPPVWIPMPPH